MPNWWKRWILKLRIRGAIKTLNLLDTLFERYHIPRVERRSFWSGFKKVRHHDSVVKYFFNKKYERAGTLKEGNRKGGVNKPPSTPKPKFHPKGQGKRKR